MASNQTANYGYPVFSDNDIPTWLGDWNNTVTAIDKDIKAVDTLVQTANTDITGLEQQVSNNHDEINNLTAEVSDLTTTVQGNTSNIAGVQNTVANQNNEIAAIKADVAQVSTETGTIFRGVLPPNDTTLAISIDAFTANTLVDVYSSAWGVNPETVELRPAQGGQPNLCITTWPAQASDLHVAVVIR